MGKNVGMLDFVMLDIDLVLTGIAYDHEITQHTQCVFYTFYCAF